MKKIIFSLLILISICFTANFSYSDERGEEIEELRQQVIELQKRIEKLEQERASSANKTLKTDSGFQKSFEGINAGYDKGFYFNSADGNYKLKMKVLSQFQFSVTDSDDSDTSAGFDVRRLRFNWSGNAFRPWFLYLVQLDTSPDVSLTDAFVDFAYYKSFAPRIGQYKVPFSREQLTGAPNLLFAERSQLDREFGFGRDRGAGIYGVAGKYITYGAGVFNGDGRNGGSTDSNMLYAGRVQFTPCCGELAYAHSSFPTGGDYNLSPNFGRTDTLLVAVSISGAAFPGLDINNKTPSNNIERRFNEIGTDSADVYSITADVNVRYSRLSMEGYYFYRNIDPDQVFSGSVSDQGYGIQGGVFLLPDIIEVAGRFVLIDFDEDVDGRDTLYSFTPGVNVYFFRNQSLKLQINYTFSSEEDTFGNDLDSNIFRAQLQALF